jgi:hypothetical protein
VTVLYIADPARERIRRRVMAEARLRSLTLAATYHDLVRRSADPSEVCDSESQVAVS